MGFALDFYVCDSSNSTNWPREGENRNQRPMGKRALHRALNTGACVVEWEETMENTLFSRNCIPETLGISTLGISYSLAESKDQCHSDSVLDYSLWFHVASQDIPE